MESYVGEIRIMAGHAIPAGWLPCDGRLVQVRQYHALFSLIGTTYGGDGKTTFALPNLQARTIIHQGHGYAQGRQGGEEFHVLTVQEIPEHNHVLKASTQTANSNTAAGHSLAVAAEAWYAAADSNGLEKFNKQSIATAGADQRHENRQPYIALNFMIAWLGNYPPRS